METKDLLPLGPNLAKPLYQVGTGVHGENLEHHEVDPEVNGMNPVTSAKAPVETILPPEPAGLPPISPLAARSPMEDLPQTISVDETRRDHGWPK